MALFSLRKVLSFVISQPLIYDQFQSLAGANQISQWLLPHISPLQKKLILDIGAGTGLYRSLVSSQSNYIWTDIDPQKLQGFTKRRKNKDFVLLSDATRLGIKEQSINLALCIFVVHHLSDSQLHCLFDELSRVVKDTVIILDPLDIPTRHISNLLWKLDRGNYPRPATILQQIIEDHFRLEQVEYYHIYHHYLLCVATPKKS